MAPFIGLIALALHVQTWRVMGPGARILVVDGGPDLGELWQTILTADGHAVDLAIGGKSALAHLAAGAAYDLVVCDLHMPGVDGVDVYRAIKQLAPTGPAVQFMACCAGSARYEGFLRTTGAPVLPKPFHLDALREAVRRAVARRLTETRRAENFLLGRDQVVSESATDVAE